MNHGLEATERFFSELKTALPKTRPAPCSPRYARGGSKPAFSRRWLSLAQAKRAGRGSAVHDFDVGAQNVHWEKSGAFTGEVSGPMLAELGITPRARRPLRTPAVLRRNRRDRPQAQPRACSSRVSA